MLRLLVTFPTPAGGEEKTKEILLFLFLLLFLVVC